MATVTSGPDIRVKLAVAVLSGLAGMVCGGLPGMLAPALAALPLLLWLRQGKVIAVMLAAMSALYFGFVGLVELGGQGARFSGPVVVAANLSAYVFYFMLKMTPLTALFVAICRTSRLGELLAALTGLGLPRSLVLAVAVTFRFTPTLTQEFVHIRDALALRDSRGWLRRNPLRRFERLLLPLLVRAARLADELSASALTRGVEAPEARSPELARPGAGDLLVLIWAAGVLGLAAVTGWRT